MIEKRVISDKTFQLDIRGILVEYPCEYTFGFCGMMTAGKSTFARAAQFLLTPFYDAQVCSFAYDVYRIAYEFGWDGKKDEKGRKILQLIGTEVGREYDADVWLKYALMRLKKKFSSKEGNVALFDDLRFVNEVEWIKDNGGTIIKVTDNEPKDTKALLHESENGIPDQFVDFEIVNNYNILDTIEQLHGILNGVGLKTLKAGEQ